MPAIPARLLRRIAGVTIAAVVGLGSSVVVATSAIAADEATVTGTVTEEGTGTPLGTARVRAFDVDGLPTAVDAITEADGTFTLTLPPGTYTFQFIDFQPWPASPVHVTEWWGDQHYQSAALPVVVAAGAALVLDAALARGTSLSGTITGAGNGQFVAVAYTRDPGSGSLLGEGASSTLPGGGSYSIGGLDPALDYRVRFEATCTGASDCIGRDLHPEYYDNAISFDSANLVSVTAGVDTPNINAVLGTDNVIPFSRISGPDRFSTSAAIAALYDPADVDVLYVANGMNYPDALSAAPAAVSQGAPLLLTPPGSLPVVIAEQIERLNPSTIVIAGGVSSVSGAVESAIHALVPSTIVRLAGADRYETSRKIADYAFGDGATSAWVVTGLNFPDALSAAPLAGATGSPVILVNGQASAIDSPTASLLNDLGSSTVFIVGNVDAVTNGIKSSIGVLPGVGVVPRIAGADRYSTSLAINNLRYGLGFSDVLDNVYLATGLGFADALSGAALAGRDEVPMYVVPPSCAPSATRAKIISATPGSLILFGGQPSLADSVGTLTAC